MPLPINRLLKFLLYFQSIRRFQRVTEKNSHIPAVFFFFVDPF